MARHGTNTGYARGCRCAGCTRAHRIYQQKWILRGGGQPTMLPARGAVRRIRALQRMGYTIEDIGKAVGSHATNPFGKLLAGGTGMVTRDLHNRLDAAYERMSATPGPSLQTRAYAIRQGWAPPLAWDDIDTDDGPKGIAA